MGLKPLSCFSISTCCLFFKGNFFCLCQYVHYKVDYSDVELNKEEKEKDKRKEEKVCLVYHFVHWLLHHWIINLKWALIKIKKFQIRILKKFRFDKIGTRASRIVCCWVTKPPVWGGGGCSRFFFPAMESDYNFLWRVKMWTIEIYVIIIKKLTIESNKWQNDLFSCFFFPCSVTNNSLIRFFVFLIGGIFNKNRRGRKPSDTLSTSGKRDVFCCVTCIVRYNEFFRTGR